MRVYAKRLPTLVALLAERRNVLEIFAPYNDHPAPNSNPSTFLSRNT
jgi:hypothetical protein